MSTLLLNFDTGQTTIAEDTKSGNPDLSKQRVIGKCEKLDDKSKYSVKKAEKLWHIIKWDNINNDWIIDKCSIGYETEAKAKSILIKARLLGQGIEWE